MTTTPARPGRPRSTEAERAILTAAAESLAEHGVEGFRIEQVAQRANVAKTTIYRRWPDKHALIRDTLVQLKEPLPAPPGVSVRDDLIFLLTVMRDRKHHSEVDRVARKLFAEIDKYPDIVAAYRAQIIEPGRAVWLGVLQRGVAAGTVRADASLNLLLEMMISPVLCSGVARREPHSDAELAQLIDFALASVRPSH